MPVPFESLRRRWGAALVGWGAAASLSCSGAEPLDAAEAGLAAPTKALSWSEQPPGLSPVDVPQFVAVTFDDNFVSGIGDPAGGMTWATDFFRSLTNPAGSNYAPTFDGAPVRTSFYFNCVYLEDDG